MFEQLPKNRKEAILLSSKFYFTGIYCSRGELSKRKTSNGMCLCLKCVDAKNKSNKITMQKAYKINPEKFKTQASEYYKKAKESNDFKEKVKLKRIKNKEYHSEYLKEYRKSNRDKINNLHKNWAKKNKINIIARRLIYRLVTEYGFEKNDKTKNLLGYSLDDLKIHLERQFTKGMSWNNYGEWHIDHIIPISKMVKDGVKNPKIINCLYNLQPLWALDNIKKGNRVA